MDLRGFTGRAAQKIKSVFSKDNRFFYGSAQNTHARENDQEEPQLQNPTVHSAYPYAYQQPQPQAWAPNAYQQPKQAYQHPGNQQEAPVSYSPYQSQPQQYQQPVSEQAGFYPGYSSPQQAQLNQQQAEQTVRNRRAAQHMENPGQENNIVQFPGNAQDAEKTQVDVYVVNITNINGCRQAMTCLRKGQCTLVVMDQLIDKAEVRRYVDMLNGASFALGGTMTRLSLKVGFYVLAPSGMMVYTDPLTASANAPRQQMPQQPGFQNQGTSQPQMNYAQSPYQQQPYPYVQQATNYQPQAQQQNPPQPRYQAYQQQPQTAYQPPYQQAQNNPYLPNVQQPQQDYVSDPYDAQRYAQ